MKTLFSEFCSKFGAKFSYNFVYQDIAERGAFAAAAPSSGSAANYK